MARVPTKEQFLAGVKAYEEHESRGNVYFDALGKVQSSWGDSTAQTEGIWLLLNSWHRGFYRFGAADLSAITKCIDLNLGMLNNVRPKTIDALAPEDEINIKSLFNAFKDATRRKNNRGSQESPVAAAKTLHLLSPAFLPLWDDPIAGRFGCTLMNAADYVTFCWDMKDHTAAVQSFLPSPDDRTILKRIDEFNYSAYTKDWVVWR